MASKVILYSGGMDSYILAYMHEDAKLVYIDANSRYTEKELDNLYTAPRDVTVVRGLLDISQIERQDAIVPARNVHFVTIGALYGDTVLLGATAGDLSEDKDDVFASMMSAVLSRIYTGKHFTRKPVRVELPIKSMTKKALLEWYIAKGLDPMRVARTVSCYSGEYHQCGFCKACVRKFFAFAATGIDISGYYDNDPRKNDYSDIRNATLNGVWRTPEEDAYTLRVIEELS